MYKRQIVESSRPVDFGEDWLRGKGSLPATFYVLTRVKSVSYTHIDVYKRQL